MLFVGDGPKADLGLLANDRRDQPEVTLACPNKILDAARGASGEPEIVSPRPGLATPEFEKAAARDGQTGCNGRVSVVTAIQSSSGGGRVSAIVH
jgi:hypothetical protein